MAFITDSDLKNFGTLLPMSTDRVGDELAIASQLKKLFEGCRLEAYPDPLTNSDPWTISLGLTFYSDGSKVQPGDQLTSAESDREVDAVLQKYFLPHVQKIPHWAVMSPYQKGALISFAWNLGAGFYGGSNFSTISSYLRTKDWAKVPDAMMLYRNPNSNVELGLGRRRFAEGLVWTGQSPQEAYEQAAKIVSVAEFA